jgi:hypothetical protein
LKAHQLGGGVAAEFLTQPAAKLLELSQCIVGAAARDHRPQPQQLDLLVEGVGLGQRGQIRQGADAIPSAQTRSGVENPEITVQLCCQIGEVGGQFGIAEVGSRLTPPQVQSSCCPIGQGGPVGAPRFGSPRFGASGVEGLPGCGQITLLGRDTQCVAAGCGDDETLAGY